MKGIKWYALICHDKRYSGRILISSYFKDIYLYLAQNKPPSSKIAMRKIEALAEKYI